MQSVLNLKSFLAVLMVLILPAALLVAYFRNYSPEAAGHEHGQPAKSGGAAMNQADGRSVGKPSGDNNAARAHDTMAHPSTARSQPPPPQGPRQSGATSAPEQLSMATTGVRPGIPGASHLYHLGSTAFFLDHPQHLPLSTEQRKKLNQIKEQVALNKASADRSMQEAEQRLWKLTGADQPDAAQIETNVREIGKLRTDQRVAFIRSVGEAAKVLTEEQTKRLLGTAAPVRADLQSATPESKLTNNTEARPVHQHKP